MVYNFLIITHAWITTVKSQVAEFMLLWFDDSILAAADVDFAL